MKPIHFIYLIALVFFSCKNEKSTLTEPKNEASNPKYAEKIKELKALLPKVNSKWNSESNYTFQPYFVEQKKRVNGQ